MENHLEKGPGTKRVLDTGEDGLDWEEVNALRKATKGALNLIKNKG